MKLVTRWSWLVAVCAGLGLPGGLTTVSAAEAIAAEADPAAERVLSQQLTFKLTFANADLVWHGDPASPVALIYLKPGAEPLATDAFVTTLTESRPSPGRRYMDESRIAEVDGQRLVYAFTSDREKVIGSIDGQGIFQPNAFYAEQRRLLPSWPRDAATLSYDPQRNSLYYEVELPGPEVSERLAFLPLPLLDSQQRLQRGEFTIDYSAAGGTTAEPRVALNFSQDGSTKIVGNATLPEFFLRADVILGSFDNARGTYLPESAYRADATGLSNPEVSDNPQPSVTFTISGDLTERLNLADAGQQPEQPVSNRQTIKIDGDFSQWRNIPGVSDPRGDVMPYLEYVPDVDLLEFKVAHDDEHIYLYARVAGQVGRTHPDGGRSYFYAYLDVDQDAGTGFLPSRDDDCYFGVDIGDDCEVQFEFVDNTFRKTFYGFCGLGGNQDVLNQVLTIGKSQYGRFDERGNEREHYKAEYIYRDGVAEITKDLKLGTSDTIQIAVSPDGSEVEVASTFAGFLKNRQGKPILGPGQTIDLAIGMESDSKAYPGKRRWGADSTPALRGYYLSPGK